MNLLLILLSIYLICSFIGLYKIFAKAGENPIMAFVPGYNYFIWMKILEKPWWWMLIMIFPGLNFLMYAVYVYCTSIAMDKRSSADLAFAAFFPFLAILRLGFDPNITFIGTPKMDKKSTGTEWFEALIFAVIAASIIRGYFLEAFTIPTSSMEKDLLIGDYLFVSKLHYGVKVPETPVSLPFVHNNLPFSYIPSYFKSLKIPYTRLPKFTDVKRFDRVVFNFPTGDTAILGNTAETSELQGHNYYQMVRDQALYLFIIENRIQQMTMADQNKFMENRTKYEAKARKNLLEKNTYYTSSFKKIKTSGYVVRPTDKKENYIKRCVALPGDVLEFKNGTLWINGEQNEVKETQHFYYTTFNRVLRNNEIKALKTDFNISPVDIRSISNTAPLYSINMSAEKLTELKNKFSASSDLQIINTEIKMSKKDSSYVDPRLSIYPNHPSFHWTQDNFGPLWMPKEGETITLSDSTYYIYKRCIETYEHNSLEKRADGFYLNGEKADSYTFKQGYYYLVGDNRHNSADSRFWGFVPHDHVVGRAVFIWMSIDNDTGNIRWDRLFTIVHD